VLRLDEYIARNISVPERIRFIKIDVERFELAVLKGLSGVLESGASRPLIAKSNRGNSASWAQRRRSSISIWADSATGHTSSPKTTNPPPVASLNDMEVVVFRA
jgi:hypothetical protein